ncbi:MAG: hypothetical protein EAX91_05730 [Candidatus Lokiarchaeota archaeon]|nr:hypothetical protein [Candidatus Lokiarchaeota archaeon]
MTLKQEFLNTFAKKETHKIVFSPRLYYWYFGNKIYSKLRKNFQASVPVQYYGRKQIEIYRDLCVSPRYSEETLYLPLHGTKIAPTSKIQVYQERGAKIGETITSYKTPLGKLKQVESIGGGLGAHKTEYPIKTLEDIKIMQYILEHTSFFFLKENYEKADRQFADITVTSTYLSKSPYQKLIIEFMGLTRTLLFLKKNPSQLENFMMFLEHWDDEMYEQISKSPLEIVNFGENLDSNLSPPPYFERYLLPYYEKRAKQLHRMGKYCHIHIDGSLRDFLPYLEQLPFDGFEALTAKPQGDVRLEDIQDAIGDKVLLDGIPSILFLPEYSNDYLMKYTEKVLELFSPHLILGVSDELSPNGDIRKIQMLSDYVKEFNC